MKKRGNNVLCIFLYLFGIVIAANLYSKLSIKKFLPFFFYINIDNAEVRNLVNTIWQVQGAISLLSITLTSLIIGNLEKCIYGQPIKEILFIRRSCSITYWDKVIISLGLSIINLFFVSRGDLPGTSFIFIVNGIVIFIIISETFNLLFDSKKYNNKVKQYIEYKYRIYIEDKEKENAKNNKFKSTFKNIFAEKDEKFNDILQLFYYDILDLIDKGDRKGINSNLVLFLSLYNNKIKYTNNNYNMVDDLLDDKIIKIVDKLLEKNKIGDTKEILNQILNQDFKYKYKNILVEKVLYKLVDNIITFRDKEQFYSNRIHRYLFDIFDENNKILPKDLVACLEYRYFFNVVNNNYLQCDSKQELIDEFIDFITYINYLDENVEEYFIYKYSIFTISKELIRKNDTNNFSKLISKLFINNRLGINSSSFKKVYEIIATLDIFIYYASFKEEYFIGNFKDNVRKMITVKLHNETKDTYNLKEISILSEGAFWGYFELIKEEMPKCNWEYMPMNACEEMIIDEVIDEFYVFYSMLYTNFGDLDSFKPKLKEINHISTLLQYFNETGSLKDEFRVAYKCFSEWLGETIDETYKNDYFYMFLKDVYKELMLKQIKDCIELKDIINKNIVKMKEKIEKVISNSIFYNDNINYKISKEYVIGLQLLDIRELAEKVTVVGIKREDIILNAFEEIIIKDIVSNSTIYNYHYSNEHKIENLFEKINSLKKDLDINAVINRGEINKGIIEYKENSLQIDRLRKFEDGLINLGNLNRKDYVFYLDKNKIKAKLNIAKVDIRDLEESDVEFYLASLEKDQNFYVIPGGDNIKLFFEEEEAKWYMKNKYKFLEVRCNIELNIEHPCGVLLKINKNIT